MQDVACLIAPRPLVVVAGERDPIFPITGVEKASDTIQAIYEAAAAPDACRLVVGDGEHRFFADLAWPALEELTQWQ